MSDEPFGPGDRVELVRHYSFFGDPPPQGTVVGKTNRLIRCKMDRSGKLIGFPPSDLRRVERSPTKEGPGVNRGRG